MPSLRLEAVVDLVTAKVADEVFADWSSCFAGLSAQEAKRLARDGAKELGLPTSTRSLTYGEVDFFSFASILEQVNPPTGSLFVDIGHGTGRAVLAAALLRGSELRECRGVEVLAPLYEASLVARDRYAARLLKKQYLYSFSPQREQQPACEEAGRRAAVTLFQGDLLAFSGPAQSTSSSSAASSDEDDGHLRCRDPTTCTDAAWTDGDFIFVNSTCFSKELMVST
jgi:hypothetical protein